MKLLFCPWCRDLVVLRYHGWRACECGTCRGRYVKRHPDPGESDARVEGELVQVIGISNPEFRKALATLSAWPPIDGAGDYDYDLLPMRFKAWFFGPNAREHTKSTPES